MLNMLDIRNLTINELDKIDLVLMAAYDSTSSFIPQLQRNLALQPDGWLVAESNGILVGMVGAVDYCGFAYVGLMGVHPAFQHRGIGTMLMKHLLAWLDEHSCYEAALDATASGAPLYARHGFVEVEKSLVFYQQNALEEHPGSFEQIGVLRSCDLSELAAFDKMLFGADRRTVFATLLSKLPNRAFVARNQAGQIVGYLFAQSQKLGPWAASTPTIAEALLLKVLPLSFDGTPGVLVPGANPTAKTLLLRYGFKQERTLSHMRRGGNAISGSRALIYGMTNFALG